MSYGGQTKNKLPKNCLWSSIEYVVCSSLSLDSFFIIFTNQSNDNIKIKFGKILVLARTNIGCVMF